MFELTSVSNARSLQGIKTSNGYIGNKLYRSARLINISLEDVCLLKDYNIKTVIDFRTSVEFNEAPDKIDSDFNYISLPVFKEETVGVTRDNKSNKDLITILKENQRVGYAKEFMTKCYTDLIGEHCLSVYKKFFDYLLDSEGGVLWHCTAGKDRAGVATIYLLLALGVSKSDIINEYLLTNKLLEEENKMIIENVKQRHNEMIANELKDIFTCKTEYVNIVFDEIENNYKSINDFLLKAFDLDETKINKLKEKFIVKDYTSSFLIVISL